MPLLSGPLACHLRRGAKLEVLAEVNLSYHFVVGKILCRTRFKYLAFVEQIGAVGYGERLVDVVVGYYDAYILLFQRAYDTFCLLYTSDAADD